MKITKNKAAVNASDEILVVPDSAEVTAEVVAEPEAIESECKYQCAIDLISSAIESLAEIARDDQIAKDSIANLGVVMLDLKGGF